MSDHPLRVAVLGGPGTYSDAAAIAFFGDSIEAIGKSDFDAIFKAVTNGHADRGIVPIENSLAGSIHRNYDLLLRHDLSIIGESQIHIAHQLLALPGVGHMEMTGRRMGGFVDAGPEALSDDATRARLMALSLAFNATLPPK